MAEAIGIGASVIAVIQLTAQLAAISYKYISGVKQAHDEVRNLLDESKLLSIVFTNLEVCVRDNPGSTSLKDLEDPLQKCALEIQNFLKKLEPKGWLGKKRVALVWPFKERETLDFVLRMARYNNLFSLMLKTAEMSRSKLIEASVFEIGVRTQEITDDIKEIKMGVGYTNGGVKDVKGYTLEMKSNVQEVKNNIQDLMTDRGREIYEEGRINAINWLYPGTCNERHLEISGQRKKDTGLWIFGVPEMQDWVQNKDPNSRLIWGYGIPGAGKTFLSSLVIDRLQEQAPLKKYGVAYIYFNYKEEDKQKPRETLASIVKQLICQMETLSEEVKQILEKLRKEHEKPSIYDLYSTLTLVIQSFARVFIVCDALDECNLNSRRELLPLFHRMKEEGINLFLTSRDYPEDIQESLSKLTKIKLWARDEDIASCIKQKISDYPRIQRLIQNGNHQGRVISEITKCAGGMFLLVHFQIEHLCKQTTPRGFLKELEGLGNSFNDSSPLNPIYDRAMEIIKSQNKEYLDLAFKTLSWLVMAQGVLTIRELQMAVSMEEGKISFNEHDDVPEISTVLEACASLVTVDEQSQTVRLAHYTIQEYLELNPIFIQNAKAEVCISCIAYISLAGQNLSITDITGPISFPGHEHSFLFYVLKNLPYHVKDCGDEAISVKGLLKLLENRLIVEFYSTLPGDTIDSDGYYRDPPLLHLAARLGNTSVCRVLLEDTDIMLRDPKGNTPLHIAVSLEDVSMVKLFLEKGAKVGATNRSGETTLHIAAQLCNKIILGLLLFYSSNDDVSMVDSRGDNAMHILVQYYKYEQVYTKHESSQIEACIKLLLENGADIDAINSSEETALLLVAENKVENGSLARLLLENGANVNIVDRSGQTALHLAVMNRDRSRTNFLPGNRANVNTPTGLSGGAALHSAVDGENTYLTELLLGGWTNVNSTDLSEKSAPQFAAITRDRDESLIELLLRNGVDIDAVDSSGQTALHVAAMNGDEFLVKLLLRNGANINAEDLLGQTALHLAVNNKRESLIILLLENGANVEVADFNCQTALHMAVRDENEYLTKLLLENGANINAADLSGYTALLIAVESKKEYFIHQLLMKNGIDTSVDDLAGRVALDLEVRDMHESFVTFLLENGANIDDCDTLGEVALHLAVKGKNEPMAKLLLEKGANIDRMNSSGESALHLAVKGGDESLIGFLLENGANIDATDFSSGTVLHWAVGNQDEDLVGLLLSFGASTNITGGDLGETVLHTAVRSENEFLVISILDNGTSTEIPNCLGQTALHIAVMWENIRLVRLLLSYGADPDVIDMEGSSPLSLATQYGGNMFQLLAGGWKAFVNFDD